jgi:hypothetical protein
MTVPNAVLDVRDWLQGDQIEPASVRQLFT